MGSISDRIVGITAPQRANAALIENAFRVAGYSDTLIAAALVNALVESGLNAKAAGDNGASVGLFQLNRVAGAGRGYSVQALEDPSNNVRILLALEKKALAKVEAAVTAGAGVAEAAGLFAVYVERPRDTLGEKARRAAAVARYFPVAALAPIERGATDMLKVYTLTGAAGLVLLGTVLSIRKWKRARHRL